MRIAVGFATRGRAAVLTEVLRLLAAQERAPDGVIVCGTAPADVAGVDAAWPAARVLITEPGLPRQRNAILRAAGDADILVFLDDDFLMASAYLRVVEHVMTARPELAGATGDLFHDDVKGPGMRVAEGAALIAREIAAGRAGQADEFVPQPHLYGCNMALRLTVVRAHGLSFDERLPLYGWSEDIDFTHRLARHGGLVKLRGARGVHLGVKEGRTPGYRLGYSQVANPVYLFRKGSYSAGRAGRSVLRNLAANAGRAVFPEPHIDRRGRLRGNLRALLEMCVGRMRPERVLEL